MKSSSPSRIAFASGRLLLGVVLLVLVAVRAAWAQAPADIEATLKQMLTATENRSVADFVAKGDASFRTDITPPMFNSYSAQVGPRLKKGYTPTFLATLHQEGYVVYLWKLEFKDGGDDMLFSLAFKDGKVGGFFLR
jgi:hypothetical protein